jgi:hypothetical protein
MIEVTERRTKEDWAHFMEKIAGRNQDLRRSLEEKGRKYVEDIHYSKKIAKQLIDLYTSI